MLWKLVMVFIVVSCHSSARSKRISYVRGNKLCRVLLQEIKSTYFLNLLGEGSAEHEGLPLWDVRHGGVLHYMLDVGHEAHVQHLVRFVQHDEPNGVERNAASVQDVLEATHCGYENVTSSLWDKNIKAYIEKWDYIVGISVDFQCKLLSWPRCYPPFVGL